MKKILLTSHLLGIALFVVAQTYKGTVYDTEGKPVPFANVELYSLPDSTFVEGTTTDDNGAFLLETKKAENGYLSISFIGYETKTVIARENLGTITIKEAMNELGEVVVKAKRPIIRQQAGKIIVGISGSSLSEAGSLMDVLKRTPGLQVKDEKINVFGRGTPIVFINGREVKNPAEYENLQSENIATIEIDRNPSAKYSASGNSVVRIITKRNTANRVNLQLVNKSYFARKYSNVSGLRVNSKWNKTQVSANYTHSLSNGKNYETAHEINTQPNYILKNENHSEREPERKMHNLFTSISQGIGDNHTLGAQFSYVNNKTKQNEHAEQKITKTNAPTIFRKLQNNSDYTYDLATYNVNYQFNIDSITKLQILADYTHSTADDEEYISENNITANSVQESSFSSYNNYDVYSAKADFETVIAKKLPFELGVKLSKVENDGSTLVTDLLSQKEKYTTSNKTTDRIGAFYAMISPSLGKWNLEAGLRYEYTDRNVKATGETVLDTAYGKWFPSVNISREFSPRLDFSLSYAKKIYRPSFDELNSNRNYIDSLAYSVGNPKLKATISHNIAMNIGLLKKLYIGLEYEYNSQDREMSAISDTQNPDIVAYTRVNIDKTEYLRATLDYRQSYKFWEGVVSFGLEKPFMEIPYLNEIKKIRKLAYYFQLNNDFKISDKLTLLCNFNYYSPSEDLMSYYYKTYNLVAGLNASFLKDKLKFGLYVNDILNASETAWKDQYGNIESYSNQDRDNTFLRVSVKYNINSYKNGISKKTAGSAEINRM